jgi:FixJ family two-component response regulator
MGAMWHRITIRRDFVDLRVPGSLTDTKAGWTGIEQGYNILAMPPNLQTSPVITIIDDDHSVLVATQLLVSSFGFETRVFASAEDFLRSSNLDETACLISDINMPRVTGIELQRMLRSQGRDLPTILMTAFSNENVKSQAIAGGAVCFLLKPFDAKTLLGCIKNALSRS